MLSWVAWRKMCYGTVSYGQQTAPVWDSEGGPDRDFIRLIKGYFVSSIGVNRVTYRTVTVHVDPMILGLLVGP